MNEPADQPAPTLPIVPILAMVLAAVVGPFIWVGFYQVAGSALLPPLIIGLLIGAAGRFTGNTDARLSILAALLTIGACYAGYVYVDMHILKWTFNNQPVQPTIGDASKRFFGDLVMLILIALSAYFAFALATRKPVSASAP